MILKTVFKSGFSGIKPSVGTDVLCRQIQGRGELLKLTFFARYTGCAKRTEPVTLIKKGINSLPQTHVSEFILN